MHCSHCGMTVAPNTQFCPKCAAPIGGPPAHGPYASNPSHAYQGAPQKDRSTYILLAILLGLFGLPGIHNLYVGRTGLGLLQLLGTILSCWILWLPFLVWTIVEACVTRDDVNGVPLR